MTRKEAKELLPIIKAFAEGKTIQYKNYLKGWQNINKIDGVSFIIPLKDYRIKPEPKYRPFKTQEECWNEMLKHQPFGWIRNKINRTMIHISFAHGDYVMLATDTRGLGNVFNKFEFIDGTPFGIEAKE